MKNPESRDFYFMQQALKLAQKAYGLNEVPVGALVVSREGIIMGRGYNISFVKKTVQKHAEMIALEKAAKKMGDWRLEHCVLYVTLEPCLMCLGAALLSRVERIVYGATSPLFGAGMLLKSAPPLYTKHIKEIVQEKSAQESLALLSDFFKKKRNSP